MIPPKTLPGVPLLPGWVNYWGRVYDSQRVTGRDAAFSARYANSMTARATIIELQRMQREQAKKRVIT